jgi:hypothetical protein
MNADLSTGELRISAEYGSPTERIAMCLIILDFHREVGIYITQSVHQL